MNDTSVARPDRYAQRPPTVGSIRSAIECGIVGLDSHGYLANGADDLVLLLHSGYALAAVDVIVADANGARFTRVLAVAEALVCKIRPGSRILGYEPDRYGGVLLRVLPPYDRRLDALRDGFVAGRQADAASDLAVASAECETATARPGAMPTLF